MTTSTNTFDAHHVYVAARQVSVMIGGNRSISQCVIRQTKVQLMMFRAAAYSTAR